MTQPKTFSELMAMTPEQHQAHTQARKRELAKLRGTPAPKAARTDAVSDEVIEKAATAVRKLETASAMDHRITGTQAAEHAVLKSQIAGKLAKGGDWQPNSDPLGYQLATRVAQTAADLGITTAGTRRTATLQPQLAPPRDAAHAQALTAGLKSRAREILAAGTYGVKTYIEAMGYAADELKQSEKARLAPRSVLVSHALDLG